MRAIPGVPAIVRGASVLVVMAVNALRFFVAKLLLDAPQVLRSGRIVEQSALEVVAHLAQAGGHLLASLCGRMYS